MAAAYRRQKPREEAELLLRLKHLRGLLEVGWRAAPRGAAAVPSHGQCAATAIVIQRLLGGLLVSTTVNGTSHWLNRVPVGASCYDIDLTGDQFGFAPVQVGSVGGLYPNTRVRLTSEVHEETLGRAQELERNSGFKRPHSYWLRAAS